ncbi:hypothetical protein [Nocardia wallacei]|uniref:hypothetical protein n=1 Tax=Nocardia wallacei TaxID=480035 RepID=UPI00245732B0|nr:hypothetical protein [Nocardia wallacei]
MSDTPHPGPARREPVPSGDTPAESGGAQSAADRGTRHSGQSPNPDSPTDTGHGQPEAPGAHARAQPGAAQYGSEPVAPPPVAGAVPVPPPLSSAPQPPSPGGQPAYGAAVPPPPTAPQGDYAPGSPQGDYAPGSRQGPTYGPPGSAPPQGDWDTSAQYGAPAPGYPQQPGVVPAAAPPALSVPDALGYGWKRFRANLIPWIALTLVGFVAYLAVTVVINVGNVNSLLSLLLIFLVVSVVVWLLQAAMIRGALYETDGTPPDFQAFFGFVNAGNVLLTALLVFVAAWVGAILCVFPALIIGFLCMFALHFVIDRDMGPVAAIKSSVQLVVTNVGTTLLLAVTVALLTFVSTLLCGLPLLVVGPVTAIALTYAYRVLVGGLVTP